MKMMMNNLRYLVLTILLLSTAASVFPQQVEDAVDLRLSFRDGNANYRIGEAINLNLSFTASKSGYSVERYYSPRFDDIILTPMDGIFDWLYSVSRIYSYDDVSTREQLSKSPVKIELTINDRFRFDKPGRYKVKVVSRRVKFSEGPRRENDFRNPPIPLVSNELEFDVREMSDAEGSAEVKRITALMDSAKRLQEHQKFKRDLDYLTGDVSTREKVNRFLNPVMFGGVTWLDTRKGFNIARNKKLAIELLEKALRDPSRIVNSDLIPTVVFLRILLEEEKKPSQAENFWQLGKEREPRNIDLSNAYYAELLESLPQRNGKSLIFAAYAIFTRLPKDDTSSVAFKTTKSILLTKWDEMSHAAQSTLLDQYWEKIKSPYFIPLLENILANKEPLPVWNNRANAFKRLIELDEKRARPFVIKEIQDPNSNMIPNNLYSLSDKFLPEIDDALLEQIQKLVLTNDRRLWFKFLIASRYASKKIYPELLEVYQKHEGDWYGDTRASLLSYLARINDRETMSLIEERIAKEGEQSFTNMLFQLTQVNPITPGMESLLRKKLDGENPEVIGTAAYYLSKYPNPENRRLIQKRYDRWIKEWSGRREELENPKADNFIKSQTMMQVNLLEALVRKESWPLSRDEIYRLRMTCVTNACREHFSRYPLPEN